MLASSVYLRRFHCVNPLATLTGNVRFAGGGGRPGGKPAFNWREKMQLRIENKLAKEKRVGKVIKTPVHAYGDFENIQHLFEPKDQMLIVKDDKGGKEDSYVDINTMLMRRIEKEATRDARFPILDRSALFGESKPYGMLPNDQRKKRNFSHKRIFEGGKVPRGK